MPKLISEKFKAYFALACVCFFWGTTYLALRVGVASIPPFLFSGVRQVSAGIILITYFLIAGHRLPKPKELLVHIISGILMITIANGLVAWAELYISSGLAALLCSFVPIWIIIINLFVKTNEKLNPKIIVGIILGFLGILIIFGDNLKDFSNPNYTLGIIGILIANISWAVGTVATKNIKKEAHPIFAAGLQVFAGGVFLLIFSLLAEDTYNIKFEAQGIISLIYLIFFGSILAFGAYIYALSKLPTSIVSMYAYINPLVAIILGWIILDEELNFGIVMALGVTISGIYLVNKGLNKKKSSTDSGSEVKTR